MLKKIILALVGASLLLTGCTEKENVVTEFTPPESTTYIISGRYYTSGELFTEDGNSWEYSQDVISESPSYDNQPVYALINDMGTANQFDDEILGLVLDRETAIYDELEILLSEEFSVERDGNNLHLDPEQ